MKEISDVVACVVDHGLFPHIATCLAKQMKQVYYCGPPERLLPHIADFMVGEGFENVIRVEDLWSVKVECDCFVFPDVGFSGEQKELISQGYPVWGHRGADELEVNKGKFIRTLKALDLPVVPHKVVEGLTALKEYLIETEDKYIKISRFRGDWETFHWRNWVLDEATLDCAAYRLGPTKEHILFYVFDAIDTPIEDGIDTWCINGQWPKTVLHAMERKDKSLIGSMQRYDSIVDKVIEVNEAFGPVLAEYGYCGAFSTEVRLNDKTAYFIDPTCRFGSPPSQLQTKMITNLPEIIYRGASGELVEPESPETYGAQVLVTLDREKDEWLTFEMVAELREQIKSSFSCEIDGVLRIAPNPLVNCAGWLVATGNNLTQVIERLKEYKAILPADFECDLSSLADLLKEIETAEEKGIELSDKPVPEPEIVLE